MTETKGAWGMHMTPLPLLATEEQERLREANRGTIPPPLTDEQKRERWEAMGVKCSDPGDEVFAHRI